MNFGLTISLIMIVVSIGTILNGFALRRIAKTGEQARKIGEDTHRIVNSQRTVMLNAVALLSERISKENPEDEDAKKAAIRARRDADESARPSPQKS